MRGFYLIVTQSKRSFCVQSLNPNEERRKARARGITLRDALELHPASSGPACH
jgi:hypothetical protein